MHMRIRRQQVVNLQQVTVSQDPAAQLAQCRTAFPKQEHVPVVGAPQPKFTPPSNSPSASQTNPTRNARGIAAMASVGGLVSSRIMISGYSSFLLVDLTSIAVV